MTVLVIGLLLFLGVHSVRIFADPWRTAMRARIGAGAWKGVYSLISLAGFGLVIWGFKQAWVQPLVVWTPPEGMRHLAGLLMAFAFVLLVATYVPRNNIKARLHHPMILSVKVWALAHLLANGMLVDVVLFGSLLLWSVLNFRAARQRDRAENIQYPPGTPGATMLTVFVGLAAWAAMAFWLHGYLFGVRPLG